MEKVGRYGNGKVRDRDLVLDLVGSEDHEVVIGTVCNVR